MKLKILTNNKYINWGKPYRKRYFKEVEEWEQDVVQTLYKKYPHLKEQ
jgi:hypothetical protein